MDQNINIYQYPGQIQQTQTQPQSEMYTMNEPVVDTYPAQVFEYPQNVQAYPQQMEQASPQFQTDQVARAGQAVAPTSESTAVPYVNYALYLLGIVVLFFVIKKLVEVWKRRFKLTLPPVLGEDISPICEVCKGTGRKLI